MLCLSFFCENSCVHTCFCRLHLYATYIKQSGFLCIYTGMCCHQGYLLFCFTSPFRCFTRWTTMMLTIWSRFSLPVVVSLLYYYSSERGRNDGYQRFSIIVASLSFNSFARKVLNQTCFLRNEHVLFECVPVEWLIQMLECLTGFSHVNRRPIYRNMEFYIAKTKQKKTSFVLFPVHTLASF